MTRCCFRGKVRLLKKQGDQWTYMASGNVSPDPVVIGESVWVGSITSRDGWTTTPVTDVRLVPGALEFDTANSTYRIETLDKIRTDV